MFQCRGTLVVGADDGVDSSDNDSSSSVSSSLLPVGNGRPLWRSVRIEVRVTGAGAPNDLVVGGAEVTVGVVIRDIGTCALLCSTVVLSFSGQYPACMGILNIANLACFCSAWVQLDS
jgi:hypothetical protein